MKQRHHLKVGDSLTLTSQDTVAHIHREDDISIGVTLAGAGSRTFGPYTHDTAWIQDGGTVTITRSIQETAEVGSGTADVMHLTGSGAPEDAARATLSRNPTGDDNALTFTAVAYGASGNSITIEYVDPSANDAALSVDVDGTAITVNLATNGGGSITSTAAEVKAAIEAKGQAASLVTVAIDASDTGANDDGSGVVTALAAAAMTGGQGTGIGTAGKGSLYTDYTNAVLYINEGTKAVPDWTALATV